MAKQMKLTIPETVEVVLNDKGDAREAYTFRQFVAALLDLPEWSRDWRSVRAAAEISEALKSKEPGDEVVLHSTAYDRLKKVCETPGEHGYGVHPRVLRQTTEYFEAIVDDAEKVEPSGS